MQLSCVSSGEFAVNAGKPLPSASSSVVTLNYYCIVINVYI